MPLFETYIFIDWSARNNLAPKKPSTDAIWVSEFTPSFNDLNEKYFRGRQDCFHFIVDRLLHHFGHHHRVLLGFDFAYGYPGKALYLHYTCQQTTELYGGIFGMN